MLPGVVGGGDLSLHAPLAEPAGDDQPVEATEAVLDEEIGHGRRLDPFDLHLGPVVEPGVAERLDHRQIGVGKVDVLADDPDPHRSDGGVDLADQVAPSR